MEDFGGALSCLTFLAIAAAAIVMYLAPGFIASGRKVKNEGTVWILNLFLGWTFIGWVISLALAFAEKREA